MWLNKIEAKLNSKQGWPAIPWRYAGAYNGSFYSHSLEVRQLHLPVVACACKMFFLLPTPPSPLQ